jgi:hypothetical protein
MHHRKALHFIGPSLMFISLLGCNLSGQVATTDLSATQVSIQLTQIALEDTQSKTQEPTVMEPGEDETDVALSTSTSDPDMFYEGITFSFDETLASNIYAETVPTEYGSGADDPPWGTYPIHVKFNLVEYLLSNFTILISSSTQFTNLK